jgi:hypothetical protein
MPPARQKSGSDLDDDGSPSGKVLGGGVFNRPNFEFSEGEAEADLFMEGCLKEVDAAVHSKYQQRMAYPFTVR